METAMTNCTASHPGIPPPSPCAMLWDEAFLWGVMAGKALKEAGLPSVPITAEDIRNGALSRYRMIFVPGGWAANKIKALGDQGCEGIRHFVRTGGSYLGICGGAGMATDDGIGLLPVGRKPSGQRVPSFSGGIDVSPANHGIWQGIEEPVFTAWWPSQFQIRDLDVRVLATYQEARSDAFSSDIRVADGRHHGWPGLEKRYGIFLDPARLRGEPAALEGRYGSGKVVLSMLHFDTPGDRNGRIVLRNLWSYLTGIAPFPLRAGDDVRPDRRCRDLLPGIGSAIAELEADVAKLIAAGERNLLWHWRNPLLLQWRRGVRGLEYSSLSVMIGEIRKRLPDPGCGDPELLFPVSLDPVQLQRDLHQVRQQLTPFVAKALRLLDRERLCLQTNLLSPLDCTNEEIRCLRQELFGSAMSHGGDFKPLIDAVDRILFTLIRGA